MKGKAIAGVVVAASFLALWVLNSGEAPEDRGGLNLEAVDGVELADRDPEELPLPREESAQRSDEAVDARPMATPVEIVTGFMGSSITELEREFGVDLSILSEPDYVLISPEDAREYFIARVGNKNTMTISALYRNLIRWPGWSYWNPPRIGLGNMAETTWPWLHLTVDVELSEGVNEDEAVILADSIADTWNAEIDPLAREYIEIMDGLFAEKVASGDYVQYPAALFARGNKLELEFRGGGRSTSIAGWRLKASVQERSYPVLVELGDRILELVRERNRAVRKAIESL